MRILQLPKWTARPGRNFNRHAAREQPHFRSASPATVVGAMAAAATLARKADLLLVVDQRDAYRVVLRVSPFCREGRNLPIFGDHYSRRLSHFACFLKCVRDRVRVDALKGDGICPFGNPTPEIAESLPS